ncbi:MAG: isoprenylcysteine carboxylmethyltransferase family protein [Pseudomonadota bacterium]
MNVWLSSAASLTVVAIAIISARNYNHRGETYAEDKTHAGSIRHFRFVYRYLQITSIAAGIASFWSHHPWLLKMHTSALLTVVGLTACAGTTWMFVSAKRALGQNYSPCFDAYLPSAVVQNGLYGRIRHPIYTANILLLAALFVASGSLWLLINTVVLFVYYNRSASTEERELYSSYPEYAPYMARTGRFFPKLGAIPADSA